MYGNENFLQISGKNYTELHKMQAVTCYVYFILRRGLYTLVARVSGYEKYYDLFKCRLFVLGFKVTFDKGNEFLFAIPIDQRDIATSDNSSTFGNQVKNQV